MCRRSTRVEVLQLKDLGELGHHLVSVVVGTKAGHPRILGLGHQVQAYQMTAPLATKLTAMRTLSYRPG